MLILLAVIAIVAICLAVFIRQSYARNWGWTGLPARSGDKTSKETALPAKTLWDWLELLIVPLVLVLAAFAFNSSEAAREQRQDAKSPSTELSASTGRGNRAPPSAPRRRSGEPRWHLYPSRTLGAPIRRVTRMPPNGETPAIAGVSVESRRPDSNRGPLHYE